MFGRTGGFEIILILIVAFVLFVVFGPKNLPKLGKMVGSTMKEVRKGMEEATDAMSDDAPAPAPVAETPAVEPGRKVAKVIYEDEIEEVKIDPNRKVAKIVYEDEE